MHSDGYFGERVASTYDYDLESSFSPEAVEPVVDFLAEIAGLKLKARWGGWKKKPFTNTSRSHVSVWSKPLSENQLTK